MQVHKKRTAGEKVPDDLLFWAGGPESPVATLWDLWKVPETN
jgi:hypothetical protein